jgi:hypothetical protein
MFDTAPAPQPPTAPANDEASDPSVARAERRLRWLEELAEIGMELARALRPGAAPAGEAPANDKVPVRDPAEAFAPLSRAIRLTLALEAKTDQELRDLKAGIAHKRKVEQVDADERAPHDRLTREFHVTALVVEAAEAEIEDAEALGELIEAMEERLEHDEAYLRYDERPLRETVERLCKDLDLHPDWSLWDGEGWIFEAMPLRPRFSPFNTPSRRPILNADGEPGTLAAPLPAGHDLE